MTLALVVLSLMLAAALLLMPLPDSWRGLWQGKLLDLGHVPLFALLSVLLWRSVGPGLVWPLGIALALAVLTEALQALVGRSADLGDLARGVLGCAAGATAIAAWQARRSIARFAAWSSLLAAALAWPLYDAGPYLVDACEGARDFPRLAHFQTERELLRWRWRQTDVTRVSGPDGPWLHVVFHPGPEPYPYVALRPIQRDFSGYRELCVTLTTLGARDEDLELMVSLRSGSGAEGETTHYQRAYRLRPGRHELRVNLAAIAPRAEPLPLDLSDVWIVQFFIDRPAHDRAIALHRVWLE